MKTNSRHLWQKSSLLRTLAVAATTAALSIGCGAGAGDESVEEQAPETESVNQALYTMTVIWPTAGIRNSASQSGTVLQTLYNGNHFYATGSGSCTDYCYYYGRSAQYVWGWVRSDAIH